jgi:hypothetical protein
MGNGCSSSTSVQKFTSHDNDIPESVIAAANAAADANPEVIAAKKVLTTAIASTRGTIIRAQELKIASKSLSTLRLTIDLSDKKASADIIAAKVAHNNAQQRISDATVSYNQLRQQKFVRALPMKYRIIHYPQSEPRDEYSSEFFEWHKTLKDMKK